MLILFVIGVGAIRGFAVTISMGIVISMFTAIVLVRMMIIIWLRRTRPKSLQIGTRWHVFPENTTFPFMRARYSGPIASAVISTLALVLAYYPGLRMGVDFAGGVVIEARAPTAVDHAALRSGLSSFDTIQVQEFGSPNDVLLRFEPPRGGDQEQQAAIAKARSSVQHCLAPRSGVWRWSARPSDRSC
jgi:SecD/SecF fusion protein